ncbi:hypothetical protein F5Y04DRAFT_105361 [Hypomontagnella monticulosa]|nr:hypothetical protein F5Y04DRAFT_105361 [Hypomontagnella monticulosa]
MAQFNWNSRPTGMPVPFSDPYGEAPSSYYMNNYTTPVGNPFANGFNDATPEDSEDSVMLDAEYDAEYDESYEYPMAAMAQSSNGATILPGEWYGRNRDKLRVNREYMHVMREFRSYVDEHGITGSETDFHHIRHLLLQALTVIGLQSSFSAIEKFCGLRDSMRRRTLHAPHFAQVAKDDVAGIPPSGDLQGYRDLLQLLGGGRLDPVTGQLRGGAAPATSEKDVMKEFEKRLGLDKSLMKPRKEWSELQEDAKMTQSSLPKSFDDILTSKPLRYGTTDMSPELRERLVNDFETVAKSYTATYEATKVEDDLENLNATQGALAADLDRARASKQEFMDKIDQSLDVEDNRHPFGTREEGTERFREAAIDVFVMRTISILQFLVIKRRLQLEDPSLSDEEILEADKSFRKVLAEHEEVWLEYDLFRKHHYIKTKSKSNESDRRTGFRRSLISLWKGATMDPIMPTHAGLGLGQTNADEANTEEAEASQYFGDSSALSAADSLNIIKRGHAEMLEKLVSDNDALDAADLANAQQIYVNNVEIMAQNAIIFGLDDSIEQLTAQGKKPISEEDLKKGVKRAFRPPPVHEQYRNIKRIRLSKELPTHIHSFTPGNMPGEHPHPFLPNVFVGVPTAVKDPHTARPVGGSSTAPETQKSAGSNQWNQQSSSGPQPTEFGGGSSNRGRGSNNRGRGRGSGSGSGIGRGINKQSSQQPSKQPGQPKKPSQSGSGQPPSQPPQPPGPPEPPAAADPAESAGAAPQGHNNWSWRELYNLPFDDYFASLEPDQQQDRQRAESDYKHIIRSVRTIADRYPPVVSGSDDVPMVDPVPMPQAVPVPVANPVPVAVPQRPAPASKPVSLLPRPVNLLKQSAKPTKPAPVTPPPFKPFVRPTNPEPVTPKPGRPKPTMIAGQGRGRGRGMSLLGHPTVIYSQPGPAAVFTPQRPASQAPAVGTPQAPATFATPKPKPQGLFATPKPQAMFTPERPAFQAQPPKLLKKGESKEIAPNWALRHIVNMKFEEYYDTLPKKNRKSEDEARIDFDQLKVTAANIMKAVEATPTAGGVAQARAAFPSESTYEPQSDHPWTWNDWKGKKGPHRLQEFANSLPAADRHRGRAEKLFYNARHAALRNDLDRIADAGDSQDMDLDLDSDDGSWVKTEDEVKRNRHQAIRSSDGWPDLKWAAKTLAQTRLAVAVDKQKIPTMGKGLDGYTVPYGHPQYNRIDI